MASLWLSFTVEAAPIWPECRLFEADFADWSLLPPFDFSKKFLRWPLGDILGEMLGEAFLGFSSSLISLWLLKRSLAKFLRERSKSVYGSLFFNWFCLRFLEVWRSAFFAAFSSDESLIVFFSAKIGLLDLAFSFVRSLSCFDVIFPLLLRSFLTWSSFMYCRLSSDEWPSLPPSYTSEASFLAFLRTK